MESETDKCIKSKKWLIGVNLFGLILFIIMLLNVIYDGNMLLVDRWISMNITMLQTPHLTEKVIFLTNLNGVIGSILFTVLMVALLWYKKWYRDLWFYLFSFVGVTFLFNIVKFSIERARPDSRLIEVINYSFPSGHATTAMGISLALYFIFLKRVHSKFSRIVLLLVCIVWPVMIAFSRVYLNVHWFTDVIAGLSLGLFWVTLLEIFYPHDNTRVKEAD
jgi:undecaprenyl-diphosphatase